MAKEALVTNRGKGKEIVEYLMEELALPKTTRAFSVHFDAREVVKVRCEYTPEAEKEI